MVQKKKVACLNEITQDSHRGSLVCLPQRNAFSYWLSSSGNLTIFAIWMPKTVQERPDGVSMLISHALRNRHASLSSQEGKSPTLYFYVQPHCNRPQPIAQLTPWWKGHSVLGTQHTGNNTCQNKTPDPSKSIVVEKSPSALTLLYGFCSSYI